MGTPPEPGSTLEHLGEDAVLRILLEVLGPADVSVGPGDDAAVLARPGGPVTVTTDAMVRGRDWRDEWSTGVDVGVKCAAQNLADVAAMGARPIALLVTLLADPATPVSWLRDLAEGLRQAGRRWSVPVVGGDLSSAGPGVLAVSVTALGDLDDGTAVLRSGARVGDSVAVCGTLGLAAAGWMLLRQGRPEAHPLAVARQRRPDPPLAAGPLAAAGGATAMLDISDGLLRDAGRIAAASRVRLDLSSDLLAPDIAAVEPALGSDLARECVLAGGEEHTLLATFRGDLPQGWRAIGLVREGEGVAVDGGATSPRGWDHFDVAPDGGPAGSLSG